MGIKGFLIGKICDSGYQNCHGYKYKQDAARVHPEENNPIIPYFDHLQGKWIVPERTRNA